MIPASRPEADVTWTGVPEGSFGLRTRIGMRTGVAATEMAMGSRPARAP